MKKYILINLLIWFLFNSLPLFSRDKMDGFEYGCQKKHEETVSSFESKLKKHPQSRKIKKKLIYAYHQLATQYAENKNWNKAIEYDKKALELDKNNQLLKKNIAVFYNNYALIYFSSGNIIQGCNYFREALKYDPDSKQIKKNFSSVLTNKASIQYDKKKFTFACRLLEEAILYDDKNWNAYVYLGEIYYYWDDLQKAVEYWEKALILNPDLEFLQERIMKTERENRIENKFNTAKIKYFKVKFEGYKDTENAWRVLRILDKARYKIGSDFKLYPEAPITVIIYTSKQFERLINKLDWVLGMYDGKIRVKKNDLVKSDELLERVLYHEYTHALIHKITKGNIPIWLNEGIAQFEEPRKDKIPLEEEWLKDKLRRKESIPVFKLENIFIKRNDINKLKVAYLESKLFVCYLVDRYGFHCFNKLLGRLGKGEKFNKSLKKSFYKDLKTLEKEWHFYLNDD
ncbi:tetratricopeptide repeat protein [bacterium]|nr:tetratricopeptide repeat protein [bacterium]